MSDLVNLWQGRPPNLLSFNEVRERLRLKQIVDRGVQEVPLDRIVGSVGREREFTRAFLPREESLRERWDDVKDLAEGQSGFPNVELYYVNNIYFVVDGHHRVSVERALGAHSIEARVKEFISSVTLEPNSTIEDVILRSGLADFLKTTGLKQSSPDEFLLTLPNGYERLMDHISVHRYYRGIEMQMTVSWEDAVESWYRTVYLPMVEIIRENGILEEFAGYTETDFYLFTMDHLHHLREQYGPSAKPERAVRHFQLSARGEKSVKERIRGWWNQKKRSKT